MQRVIVLIAVIAAAVLGCEGKQGPAGAQGPEGPAGNNRIVYSSTTAITTDSEFAVSIPEITISDMPSVAVYIRLEGTSLWMELPIYVEGAQDFGAACFYQEGTVTFVGCEGFFYKIVIVV